MTYHRVCNKGNTTGALVEQELLTLPEHLNSPMVFSGIRDARSLVFVFGLRLLITLLVTLNIYVNKLHPIYSDKVVLLKGCLQRNFDAAVYILSYLHVVNSLNFERRVPIDMN